MPKENLKFNNESQKEYYNSKEKEAVTIDGGTINNFLKKDKTDPMDLIEEDAEQENIEFDKENKEKFKKHYFFIYRDNHTYEEIIKPTIQLLEKFGNKVDTQVFPVGTEQEEIDNWIKENHTSMDDTIVASDRTCGVVVKENSGIVKLEDGYYTDLTYMEYEYKREATKEVFANLLENPNSELEQFAFFCKEVFKNNPETIPKKVYYNLSELFPTILKTNRREEDSNALESIKKYLNEEEKEILQKACQLAKNNESGHDEVEIALCLIVRTLHRILEKAASTELKQENTKIDYQIVGSEGRDPAYYLDLTFLKLFAFKKGYLDGNPKLIKSQDDLDLELNIDNAENWFAGHHHPVNNGSQNKGYKNIKKVVLDDMIQTITDNFSEETSSISLSINKEMKEKIIKDIVNYSFHLKDKKE